MSFLVINRTNNPLPLTGGTRLAPGESRKLNTVGDAERKHEARGWFSIIEEKEEPKPADNGGKK